MTVCVCMFVKLCVYVRACVCVCGVWCVVCVACVVCVVCVCVCQVFIPDFRIIWSYRDPSLMLEFNCGKISNPIK